MYKLLILVSLLATIARSQPSTIVLTGIVRDFTPDTNPDFERYLGDDRGIPQSMLDQDGKPVYNNQTSHPTITSAQTFAQWYRSIQNVNIEIPINITLTLDSSTGLYVYENQEFFPIDNLGFGNFGNSGHNFHFTTEIRTMFTYKRGDVFSFIGDDDVFVFINNKLVVDLGGVHGTEDGSIELDSLNLVEGQDYTLIILHAERRTPQSTFKISTSLSLDSDNSTTPVNPGRPVAICEVVIPNFCPGIALNDPRCPRTPFIQFPDGSSEPFDAFNAISFGDFTNTLGGDIEGRLALKENLHLYNGHWSVGYELRTGGPSAIDTPQNFSLVVGNDAYYPSGAIYPLGNNIPYQAAQEFAFVGGKYDAPDYLALSIKAECPSGSSHCLNPSFDQAQSYYSAIQQALFSVSGNVGATFKVDATGLLTITCDSTAVSSVSITITPAQLSSVNTYDTSSCNAEAQIVINVPNPSNQNVSFTGNNIYHRAEKILFNIGGAGTVYSSTKVVGSILAPHANLYQPSGVIVGIVIFANIADSLQINRLNCQTPSVVPPVSPPALCLSFEGDCAGLDFPLKNGVYSFKDFNVISFDSYTGNNGDVEGRLAVRNNVYLGADGYSVGYELFTSIGGTDRPLPYSLIVGRDLTFFEGRVFPDGTGFPHAGAREYIFAGGNVHVPDYLKSDITGNCGNNTGCLDSYFDAAQQCYIGFSNGLGQLTDNAVLSLTWNGAFITCNSNTSDTYVISITGAQYSNISYYVTKNCNFQSQWIINVRGNDDVVFAGDSFPGIAGAIVYNVLGSGRTITVRDTNLVGNLLAPQNTLNQPNGVINGKVVVQNVTASLQINREGQCADETIVVIQVPTITVTNTGADRLTLLAASLRVNDEISVAGEQKTYTVVDASGNDVVVSPSLTKSYPAGTIVSTRVSSFTTRPQANSTYVATSTSSSTGTKVEEEENGATQATVAISLALLALVL